MQYVGSTMIRFRLRFNNHKSRLKAHSKLSKNDKKKNDLVYRHFYTRGHHGLRDLEIKLIDRVSNDSDLIDKEGQWAYKLRGFRPHGLNESDFFFSQNRAARARR